MITGRWAKTVLLLACIFFVMPIAVSWGIEVPKLQGRVNDYAHMLSPAVKGQLEDTLRSFEAKESTQIVVLIIESLEGQSIEDFSIRVAEQWKIGQKGLDNGAILLISRGDRKLRIEVGYGLEGKLTDLVTGRIIREIIRPAFKAGQFDQGVIAGVDAMVAAVRGEFTAPAPTAHESRPSGKNSIHSLVIPLIIFLFIVSMLGKVRRTLGTAAGGILLPAFMLFFAKVGLMLVLLFIPIGLLAGFLISLFSSGLSGSRYSRNGGHWGSGGYWGGGGFSSGGSSGDSFSGGGGDFGGGGSSGDW